MKKMILTLGLAALMSVTALADKIGVVNTADIMSKYSKTKTIEKELSTQFNKSQSAITSKEDALKKEYAKLAEKGDKLSDSEKKAFESKYQNFQKFVVAEEDKLVKEQEKKLKEVYTKYDAAVKAVATEGKYDFIIDKAAMRFGGEDVTQKVLNKMEGK